MTAYNVGVLWDMDGVLVDTGKFHYRSWAQTLADEGIPLTWETFRPTFGRNNVDTLSTFLQHPPEEDLINRVSRRKEALFRQLIQGHIRPLPGVLPWLKRLQRLKVHQAVASSAPPANIDFLIDELRLRPYFSALCAGSNMPGKPDPAIFLLAAGALELPPGNCIVIEDSLAGIEAAKRAGMKCIAVATTNPIEALAGADLIVGRLSQIGVDEALERLKAG
jgi:HAD superfamily hydrolase (TIGR01509 family)